MSNCAVGPNGELLDASEISWFNDPDDELPIASATSLPSTSGCASPTIEAASSRRSGRVAQPSAKVRDPNNASNAFTALMQPRPKRKIDSEVDLPSRTRTRRKISVGSNSSDNNNAKASELEDENGKDGGATAELDNDNRADAYEDTKAMGDADRQAVNRRTKEERTADIRTIFTRDREHVNPDTNEPEPGHWCTLCQAAGLPSKQTFFTGGISTLRSHIRRNKNHVQVYKDRCAQRAIPVHPRAIPPNDLAMSGQGTLDGIVTRQPQPPAFTTAGLLDYIIELVVSDDHAFQLVDRGSFRRLLTYTRPALKEADIPHRTKVRNEIMERATVAETCVKERLRGVKGLVSFTFDSWTSGSSDPYLSITAHYVFAPTERPNDWELKTDQLAFAPIIGHHSGANIASILVSTIDRYDIRKKIGWFTADNASNNDRAINELGNTIDPNHEFFVPLARRVRCMEHATNVSAGHFTTHESPTGTKNILKKVQDNKHEFEPWQDDISDDNDV